MSKYDLKDGVQLAQAALEHIEQHPEEWHQGSYRCETGMCLAGHMANLSPEVKWETAVPVEFLCADYLDNGEHVAGWAARKLGMDEDDAEMGIFHQSNTLEDLREHVRRLVAGEPPKWREDA